MKGYGITEVKQHNAFIKELIESLLIYKQGDTYYFNKKQGELFGFYLTFQNKVYFYEYFEESIQECDRVQLVSIEKSLKQYVRSPEGKSIKKTSPLWSYTIHRKKHKKDEVVMKFVNPGAKSVAYRPGPGNVCIENNLGTSKEKIKQLVDEHIPEIAEIIKPFFVNNKKENNKLKICILLELVFRFFIKNLPFIHWIMFG